MAAVCDVMVSWRTVRLTFQLIQQFPNVAKWEQLRNTRNLSSSVTFKIEKLHPRQHSKLIKLFMDTFAQDEPINKSLGGFKTDSFITAFLKYTQKTPISFVAVDNKSGDVIGCMLNDLCGSSGDEAIQEVFEQAQKNEADARTLRIIKHLFNELSGEFKANHQHEKLLHVNATSVAKSHRGQGVCKQLLNRAEEEAIAASCDVIFGEPTSLTSWKIFKESGFQQLNCLLYRDYLYEGAPVLKDIDATKSPAAYLMVKNLDKLI